MAEKYNKTYQNYTFQAWAHGEIAGDIRRVSYLPILGCWFVTLDDNGYRGRSYRVDEAVAMHLIRQMQLSGNPG